MKLDASDILKDVQRALEEDLGSGDVTAALIPEDHKACAEIISREPMIVCGGPWVDAVFAAVDETIKIDWLVKEGQKLEGPELLCGLQGKAHSLLTAERTALNFLQTLSATATKTFQYKEQIKETKAQLLDTRKTLPGLRLAQKYAVVCGGGVNHRMGLFDAFLIKENHIKACGSITKAIERARAVRGDLLLEVEVENLSELQEAIRAKPDRILLDNFSIDLLQKAVEMIQGRCPLEASGGINLSNIRLIAETGVDFISIGSLTKSIEAIDLSFLIKDRKSEGSL